MKKQKAKKRLTRTRTAAARTATIDATAQFAAESKQALGGESLALAPQVPIQDDGSFRVATVDE